MQVAKIISSLIQWNRYRAIPYWNVPYNMQNFALFFSLVTIYRKEIKSYVLLSYKVLWEGFIKQWSAGVIYSFSVK